jgi:uncharacterized phage protein (TIGR01671 family)
MRKMKFRVWDNENYLSSPFDFYDVISGHIEFTDDCQVMQYTGINDKNGKEIFEGDIIQIEKPRAGNENQRRLVEWVDRRSKMVINYNCVGDIGFTFKSLKKGIGNDTVWEPFEAKVIGNIYENPELLTQHEENYN